MFKNITRQIANPAKRHLFKSRTRDDAFRKWAHCRGPVCSDEINKNLLLLQHKPQLLCEPGLNHHILASFPSKTARGDIDGSLFEAASPPSVVGVSGACVYTVCGRNHCCNDGVHVGFEHDAISEPGGSKFV